MCHGLGRLIRRHASDAAFSPPNPPSAALLDQPTAWHQHPQSSSHGKITLAEDDGTVIGLQKSHVQAPGVFGQLVVDVKRVVLIDLRRVLTVICNPRRREQELLLLK